MKENSKETLTVRQMMKEIMMATEMVIQKVKLN